MKITNEVINNYRLQGGATIGTSYSTGYMVSIEGFEKVLDATDNKAIIKAIKSYESKQAINNASVGVWFDGGMCYVDMSVNITDKEQAIQFGKVNNQLAIYGIVEREVINL